MKDQNIVDEEQNMEPTKNKEQKRNRGYVAAARQRRRERGLVAKERWAYPEDWQTIDLVIEQLTAQREHARKTNQ